MRAVITGGAGFVAKFLREELEKTGTSVIGIDIVSGSDRIIDITDRACVFELIEEIRPDIVFHLAAQASVKKSWDEPELTKKINVDGTRNILDAMKTSVPESKIVAISSAEVYGIPERLPITEEMELKPTSPYGKSKVSQEEVVRNSGISYVILRSFPHTGPGQADMFVCSNFAKQIVDLEEKGGVIKVGNLEAKRDFTDVRDIVRAYTVAAIKCSGVYNICSGVSYSIKEILDKLVNLATAHIAVETDETRLRKNDIPNLVGDNSKFCNETGWKPQIGINDTLKDMLDYWRKTA